jgi:hypothetical protein
LLAETEGAVSAFYRAAADVVERATAAVGLNQRVLRIRRDQQAAVLAGDYEEAERLQGELDPLVREANAGLTIINAVFDELPPPGLEPRAASPFSLRLHTPSDLDIDPPTGPAKVEASFPDNVECRIAGSNGCDYRVVITFTESNALEATINRVGVRWIERSGNRWWILRSGEFDDVDIVIAPNGTATYVVTMFADSDSRERRILGGKVRIRYNGIDAEGNRFSGDKTSKLERPSSDN